MFCQELAGTFICTLAQVFSSACALPLFPFQTVDQFRLPLFMAVVMQGIGLVEELASRAGLLDLVEGDGLGCDLDSFSQAEDR